MSDTQAQAGKQQCPRCKEWCKHGFCGRCERVLEPAKAQADNIVNQAIGNLRAFIAQAPYPKPYLPSMSLDVIVEHIERLSRVEQALRPFMRRWMDNPQASTYLWTLVHEHEPEMKGGDRRREMLEAVEELEAALSERPLPARAWPGFVVGEYEEF